MTATAQCTKPKTESGTWATLFEDVDVSTSKSVGFMKKLLALGVSNILYWRGLLPEEAFGERHIGENALKILRSEKECPAAMKIISWIKSSFEPISKGWLRNFYLVIRDKHNIHTIETYTFRFHHNEHEDEFHTDVYRNSKKIAQVENKTMNMLTNIAAIVRPLGPAPFPCMISIDMDFNLPRPDLSIPKDVVLPGFMPIDDLNHKFDGRRIGVNLGDVGTSYHECKLQVRTTASRLAVLMNQPAGSQQSDHQSSEVAGCTDQSPKKRPLSDGYANQARSGSTGSTSTSKDEQGMVNTRNNSSGGKCHCGIDYEDLSFVDCTECGSRQHPVCYSLNPEDQDKLKFFRCFTCAKKFGRDISDTKWKAISRYSRAMYLLHQSKDNVDHPFIKSNSDILDQLVNDGVLKKTRAKRKEGQGYRLNPTSLTYNYRKLFCTEN